MNTPSRPALLRPDSSPAARLSQRIALFLDAHLNQSVAMLVSGAGESDPNTSNRWTILAVPQGYVAKSVPNGAKLHDNGGKSCDLPFTGGWLAVLPYEVASGFDAKALVRQADPSEPVRIPGVPGATWLWCPSAIVIGPDGVEHEVRTDQDPGIGLLPMPAVVRRSIVSSQAMNQSEGFKVADLASDTGRAGFALGVQRVLDAIGSGDVYQVNLTHQLSGRFEGSSRKLFSKLFEVAEPWYGAYIEFGDAAIVSASPEMFLSISPGRDGRRIFTRPMKGTRAHQGQIDDLLRSEKERAELTMIIDLMRNDLGRVCSAGTVRLEHDRQVETHAQGSIFQATATVGGTLRPSATMMDVLRATLPAGSITGAPKLAAMKIIAQLERSPRGMYCGNIGYLSTNGCCALSVAIRTATITGTQHAPGLFASDSRIAYGVGAGIVADSQPLAEYQETLDKAGAFLRAANVQDLSSELR